MYFDNQPCRVCGADVELRARQRDVGDVIGGKDPDGTVDERVCTNRDCPTHEGGERP